MTAQQIANAFFVGLGMRAQESIQRHQDPGGTEATLQRVIAFERRLQNTETARRRREAFHRPDFTAIDLHRERETGTRRPAIGLICRSSSRTPYAHIDETKAW